MKNKCDYCGDTPTIGYLMPDGDLVCASYECCYQYCKATRAYLFPDDLIPSESTQSGAIRSARGDTP